MTGRPDADLPVVDPGNLPAGSADATEGRVAGVLLAAGTSSRFGGGNKLLASLNGDPLVAHAARPLCAADLDPLVAVVGHEAAAVRAALADTDFSFVENPNYASGQATSVRAAVSALGEFDVDGAVFALGDMPRVDPASVDALLGAYRSGPWTALAAAYEGRRGNPVLFDAAHFQSLADVDGDIGGREILLSGESSALVETGDPGVRCDVDTRADLENLRE